MRKTIICLNGSCLRSLLFGDTALTGAGPVIFKNTALIVFFHAILLLLACVGCSSQGDDVLQESLSLFSGGDASQKAEAVDLLAESDIAAQLESSSLALVKISEEEFMASERNGAELDQFYEVANLIKIAGDQQLKNLAKLEAEEAENEAQELRDRIVRLTSFLRDERTTLLEKIGDSFEWQLND